MSNGFVEFVQDQLSEIPAFRTRRMFGGWGLYSDKTFFGLITASELYFRTDEASAAAYVARGAKPFAYSRDGTSVTMAYHQVPADVIEDRAAILEWAATAIRTALAANAAKEKKPSRKKRP